MVFPSVMLRAELCLNSTHFLLSVMLTDVATLTIFEVIPILVVKVGVVVCVQIADNVTGLVVKGLAMSMLLVIELAIAKISCVMMGFVSMRLVEKLAFLVKFGDLISLMIGMSFGKFFGLCMTFIVIAFLIIALRFVVFTLVEMAGTPTIMMTIAKCLQLVAMLTIVPVTVVATSDVLSIIKAVAIIRVMH